MNHILYLKLLYTMANDWSKFTKAVLYIENILVYQYKIIYVNSILVNQ